MHFISTPKSATFADKVQINMAMDILGEALLDYQNGNYTEDIKTILTLNGPFEDIKDTLPLPYLFRKFEGMPRLEKEALNLCRGTVLDIGCGAGSHSLHLQKKGVQITALDASPGAIEVCKRSGVIHCVHSNITDFEGHKFDTLLLLMNGIGIAGTLERLALLFDRFKMLLNPDGQILLDSSDIIYLFDADDDGGHWLPAGDSYYGEVRFRMEYKRKSSKTFEWLYLDYNTLQEVAHAHDLNCELVSQGEHYDYLARITAK